MDRGNDKVVKMLSISEEINDINLKVRQLVQDLHGSQGVLMNLQDLTDKLSSKVTEFKSDVGKYKPVGNNEEIKNGVPSYIAENLKQNKVYPTPDNIHELNPPEGYTPEPKPKPKVTLDEFKKNDPLVPGNTPIKKAKPKTKKVKPPVRSKKTTQKKTKPPVNKKINKATPPKRKGFSLFGNKKSE